MQKYYRTLLIKINTVKYKKFLKNTVMKYLKKIKHIITIISFSFLLISCGLNIDSNRPTNVQYIDQNDTNWLQHLAKLEKITHYKATGQLGYISSRERFSTQFEWQYNSPTSYSLFLSSTLSKSTLLLKMQGNKLSISDNKGNYRSAKDAKILLREIVGMDVPLNKLTTWLKGQPERGTKYNVGVNHLLANFNYVTEDSHWTADYINYHEKFSIPMPRDILLKNKKQTLKIRVEHWEY